MSKNQNRAKAQDAKNTAEAAAPVAATEASSSAPVETGDGESDSTLDQSTQDLDGTQPNDSTEAVDTTGTVEAPSTEASEPAKTDISVGATKKVAKPKTPAFEPNVAERDRLQAMTNDELRAEVGDQLPSVGANDFRVFQIDESNGLKDMLVGSDLARSGIRSGVIDFLRTRVGDKGITTSNSSFEMAAPGWAIASYMVLAAKGGATKGKFDQGYLAARGNDVRRGMVARNQLRIVADLTPAPAAEAPAAEAEAPVAE